MLAQNFKTPAALGITSEEFDAALKVLNMLETGELVQVDSSRSPKAQTVRGFHMASWASAGEKDKCGTVCCIGGWMQVLLQGRLSENCTKAFYDIFFPPNYIGNARQYTVEAAAVALRAKLRTGKADWSAVAR